MSDAETGGLEGIAVVGMAGRFPRARDLRELWRNLREGVDCVSTFADGELEAPPPPEVLRDPRFVKARGVLEDADLFDARFFDIPPRQAALMDPQNRLFLECAHQALEDAGYDPGRFPGLIGVFGGVTLSSYFLNNLLSNPELLAAAGGYQIALGADRDYLTTFVSYKLGLKGPSLDVQTACSTSLVATVLACQSLLSYGCDMALAGGVSIKVPQRTGYLYTPGGLDSATGRCRSFDAAADGSVYGSGVGVVVLKRLEDALADGDDVRAVILGAALNNDGSAKVGFTAPGVEGQADVIATAQALAGIDPETLGYVECHGSGTALGDPIEVAALAKAFRATRPDLARRRFCALGSIKSNVGHCSAAAGVAGLMKTVLMLEHGEIPPSLHFERPNPAIDFENGPFYVADRLAPWSESGEPRRAGVSSFGLGGTNAHAVLQEAPEAEPSGPSRPWQLLLLSAKGEAVLEAMTDNLAADLEAHPERPLADVAFTLQAGRRVLPYRRMLVCREDGNGGDAVRVLRERDPRRLLSGFRESGRRPVAFLLPGVGDHYPGMAQGLYEGEPTFREHLDRCCDLLAPRLGIDLRTLLFDRSEAPAGGAPDLRAMLGRTERRATELDRTLYAQPAVFAVEYALARLWMEWGVRPEALLGYSLGEYVAACLAGVLSLEDALMLVAERARLIDALPAGAMLALPLAEDAVRGRLQGTGLDLTAVTAPEVCVVAGPPEAVAAFAERLAGEGIAARRLPTTHAFHSRMMEPIVPALARLAQAVRLSPPKVPYVSNVTGGWITPAEATDPGYWTRHLVQPVRFAEGLAALWKNPDRALLEVGPGFGLSTLALQQAPAPEAVAVPSLRNANDPQPDGAFLLGALGKLWLAGVAVDPAGFFAGQRRRRVRLPTYPFERTRYWVEARPLALGAALPADDSFRLPDGRRVGFEEAADLARRGELTLVEDPAVLRRLARLRELESLGARVAPAKSAESGALPNVDPEREPAAGRHSRPRLRNAYVAPAEGTEARLAELFGELLGIEEVGAHDSFFELGGHSLLGTSLLARVREAFGVELPLALLFERPAPADLAAAVESSTAGTRPAPPPLEPAPRERQEGELPLSFAQQRLWFLDQLMPGNPFYNLSGGVRLTGPLDPALLAAAVAEEVRRQESLRTGFPSVEGRPLQRIEPELATALPLVDLSELTPETREAELRRIRAERARQPFDLAMPGLLRLTLLRLSSGEPSEHALVFTIHHIVSDGWSNGLLLGEVAALYGVLRRGEPSPLPPLRVQYADFAVWQRKWLSGGELERQLGYWRERLAGAPPLDLPSDRPRPPVQSFRGATLRVVHPGLGRAVAERARELGGSSFMVLLAAFQALLLRYTAQEDVVVGTPIANRVQPALERLIGFFVNTLALRTDLSGDPSFAELVDRVRGVALGAYAHQDLPFEKLVEELQPRRDLSRNPLFQVALNLLNLPAPSGEVAAGLSMAPLGSPGGTSLFDLQGYVTEAGDDLAIAWEHATDLFDLATVERLAEHFRILLAGALEDPSRRLSDLPLLSAAERAQLAAWNDTAADLGPPAVLHEPFAARALETPDAPALLWRGGAVTYGELDRRSAGLARRLAARGVGPGHLVAILLEPSPERVEAAFAVLRAGAAYVPLDPAYPRERLEFMVRDCAASLLLMREGDAAASDLGVETLAVGGEAEASDRPLPQTDPEAPAYVIYTSGSTGRPKGVMVRHAAALNTLRDVDRRVGTGPADRVFAVSSLAFDLSVYDLFGVLGAGGAMVLPDPSPAPDPAAWSELMARFGVTLWNSAPALLELLVSSGSPLPPTLRRVMLSGDWIPIGLPDQVRARVDGVRLWSLGGATEASIWSISYPIGDLDPAWVSVPYGRPMTNQAFHVLDDALRPAPVGVVGELFIGGVGLADGYLGRPDLTAERFVPDPFADRPGARLYRTGDLGRRFPDGVIEFLGRRDHQVKVRGFRIELGEIESVLAAHPAVREAVVAAWREPGAARSAGLSQARLVAYVVPAEASLTPEAVEELRRWLGARLPEYMVPAAFVPLERLPLSPNGKVDRRALPDPGVEGVGSGLPYEAPATETEKALAALWESLLKRERVGRHDDFFNLGGHSLLATQVVARVRDAFGIELPLPAVFQEPTLERLAARVDALAAERAARPAAPALQPRRRDRRADDLRARVSNLSEAEVQELLRKKRGEAGAPDAEHGDRP